MGSKANVAFFVPHWGCIHACSFCDQRTITGQKKTLTPSQVTDTLTIAEKQMGVRAKEAEIAFFGGSFTAIPKEQMLALLMAAEPFVRANAFTGIRLSTRPDAVDDEMLALLKAHHVTSIELGAQSMQDVVLQKNGRGHTAAAVVDASIRIKQAGFSLALQMMTGLPGDSNTGARYTARRFAALHPDSVRIYPAQVIAGTQMAEWWKQHTYTPQTREDAVLLCSALYTYFVRKKIHVLRLGLHAGTELEAKRLAGPWHPAFGELCFGRIYLSLAKRALTKLPTAYKLCVSKGELSKLIGQRRRNLLWLEESVMHPLRVQENEQLSPMQVKAIDPSGGEKIISLR